MLKSHVPQLLKDHDLTAYGLATRSGIKQDMARGLRDGSLPSMFQPEAICRVLKLQPNDVTEYVISEPVSA